MTSLPKTMRGSGELVKLLSTMTSPSQIILTDAIMKKSNSNKRKLVSVIGTFNLAEITSVKTDDGRFRIDEGDMTIALVWSECDLHT